MRKRITTATGPVDEGTENAATADSVIESRQAEQAKTGEEAATATEGTGSADSKKPEALEGSSAEASEGEGIDWKAASRKW